MRWKTTIWSGRERDTERIEISEEIKRSRGLDFKYWASRSGLLTERSNTQQSDPDSRADQLAFNS